MIAIICLHPNSDSSLPCGKPRCATVFRQISCCKAGGSKAKQLLNCRSLLHHSFSSFNAKCKLLLAVVTTERVLIERLFGELLEVLAVLILFPLYQIVIAVVKTTITPWQFKNSKLCSWCTHLE